jgi:hypothetical protein
VVEISEPLEHLEARGGVATHMGLVDAILVDMVCEFARTLDIQNQSFLVPEMGTYSVPISGPFLLKHRRRFPFLGPKNVPISGTRNCVIFCKKCALICKMCALFWNRAYRNIEAVIVCVSNWGY